MGKRGRARQEIRSLVFSMLSQSMNGAKEEELQVGGKLAL